MEPLESYFETAFAAPGGIKKLRGLILTLAIQGKLVPQDHNDPPGETFRLKELVSKIGSGSTPLGGKDVYKTAGIPLIRSMNVHFGGFNAVGLAFIDEKQAERLKNVTVQQSDVLLNITGASIGRVTIAPPEMANARVNQHVCIIRPNSKLLPRYLEAYLASPLIQNTIRDIQVGATREALTKSMIEEFRLPLPSLRSQTRIIAKIDQLMARCDELERLRLAREVKRLAVHSAAIQKLLSVAQNDEHRGAYEFLSEHFRELYTVKENVVELRKAVLQLAMMGKLVPQDANDPPASELLSAIETGKKRLVKARKSKAPKPVPPVTPQEIPYSLPKGWEWVRLGRLAEFINGDRGKNYPNREEYVTAGVPWINAGHIEPDGTLTQSEMHHITREKFNSLNSGKIQAGDLLYCLRGALGKTAIVDPYTEGAIASSLMIIRPFAPLSNLYMYRYLTSPIGQAQTFRFDNGSAQPNLSANSVGLYLYPLPPVDEQRRIVAKVNKLMALCDALEQQIDAATNKQAALLNAVMAHAGEHPCA